MRSEQTGEYPSCGAFIHGFFLEGARWLSGKDADTDEETISGVVTHGHLVESRLKELLAPMPVIYLKAVPVKHTWVADSVGYIRNEDGILECPIYQVRLSLACNIILPVRPSRIATPYFLHSRLSSALFPSALSFFAVCTFAATK